MILQQVAVLACSLVLISTDAIGQTPQKKPSDPQSWTKYAVKPDEFSVALPHLPEMSFTDKSPQAGRLNRKLEASADGVVYTIAVYDNDPARQSLDDFISKQTKGKGWDGKTERSLTVNDFAGKEYVSKNKDVTAQFFATRERLYRFEATGGAADDAAVKYFFSSIILGKTSEGVEIPVASVYKGKDVDTKARILNKPEPVYPREASENRVNGIVVLRAVFSSLGTVDRIEVVSGLPYGLTESAIQAARRLKFVPATKDGKYVSMWMQLEYRFSY